MWMVEQVEFRQRELDFSSAGLGRHSTTSILFDGVEIVNALDLVASDDHEREGEPVQLIVCDHCGTPGCGSGNRVAFRRFDQGLVIMPAFDVMVPGEWERTEYGPPYFMRKHGPPFLRGHALASLSERAPELANPARWPWLKVREAVLLIQSDATSRLLGEFPAPPRLRSELVAAVSHGQGNEAMVALEALLSEAHRDDRRAAAAPGEAVTFYLDQAGYPEWQGLTFDGASYRLAVSPGLGLSHVANSA
jgi:hypothetical protein